MHLTQHRSLHGRRKRRKERPSREFDSTEVRQLLDEPRSGPTLAAMAAKPTILAVDDDEPVLRAVERDLRARYGTDYRVIAAGSGPEALETVRELTRRGDPVAAFVVDQRMPVMTGIELLREALPLQPDAKRVLLTAYADTEVAIEAINEIRLDQYILKPWEPPEERLYPVLDDLLADWSASFRPPFDGLRLLAGRWAPRGHAIRDFLTRNQLPYTWLDPEDEAGARLAESLEGGAPDPATPVVLLPTAACCATRPTASWPMRSGSRPTPRCRSTTSPSSAPARRAWRRRCTGPARG